MSYPEFFNDVLGSIMRPGSSSHTAGPCRIGYLARSLLGETPGGGMIETRLLEGYPLRYKGDSHSRSGSRRRHGLAQSGPRGI